MSIISAALSGLRTARLITVCLAIAALATVSPNSARAEYPDHPVTIVACFPAGGGTDLAARMIHVELGKALGQPVIIENRGGAGGSIGTGVVARAKPDGYTLLACSSAFVVIQASMRRSLTIHSRISRRSW